MKADEKYMHRAIEIAALGAGHVAPNPLVGAVIVHNDTIVGEGYHEKFGEAHAEVNAINQVQNPEILPECTLYVSLEPCAHHGKTPPCADLIIKKKLKRVVIGCGDSYSEVDGKGISRMKAAGIDVTTFVLKEEARRLNKKFFTVQEKNRPYVLLKWAETRNGYIDSSDGEDEQVTWVSAPSTQPFVHQLRAESDAILVGKNTILKDNPSLTTRAYPGPNPVRIVLDSNCELLENRAVFTDRHLVVVFNLIKTESQGVKHFVRLKEMTPARILETLHLMKIQSVLIEGGAATLQSFINHGLWDEAIQIIGQTTFKNGTSAPRIAGSLINEKELCGDLIKQYVP